VNRDQLAHVLRAAASIAGDGDIVVLGSQSILGTFSDARLPDEATMSVEADLAWRHDPNAAKADLVDGAIGEGSQFHSEWGYYAQGVEVSTAVLPAGWEARVEIFHRDDTGHAWARCLEPHDLCIAKLVAGREKDIDFVAALIRAQLIDPTKLHDLVGTISTPTPIIHATRERIQACVTRAGRKPPTG
jgi:uncharacterized nucleotidyltransferase DUF6036